MKGFNLYIAGESTVSLLPIENPPTLQLVLMYMCMCNYVSQVFYFLTNQQQQQQKHVAKKLQCWRIEIGQLIP